MPTYTNTDSYPRVWPWLKAEDGSTLALEAGESVDLDLSKLDAETQESLKVDSYLKAATATSKPVAQTPVAVPTPTAAKE